MNDIKQPEQTSSTLHVLGILTILGNLFILAKGLIGYFLLIDSNDTRSEFGITLINRVYFIEFLSCFGSILGAILMLKCKRIGLFIYQISSILYFILTVVFAIFCFFTIIGFPVGLLQFVYLVPSIVFFVLYLTQAKYLS